MKLSLIAIFAMILGGCQHVVVDPSVEAVASEDYTMPMSACNGVPTIGMDICIVTENTIINSSWVLIFPIKQVQILGVDVDIYYRDIHKQYAMSKNLLEIPWSDIMGSDKWSRSMDGEALALVLVRYVDNQGLNRIAKFRGIAKIVVTKEGYDRMPIGSNFASWKTKCIIEYSTAGRTAIQCK